MRNNLVKSLFIFCLTFPLLIPFAHAGLIRSTGNNGDWNEPASWIDDLNVNRVPTHDDEILIDAGHTITLYETVSLNGVTIAVRGILYFSTVPFVSAGQLDLDDQSTLYVEDTGIIDSFFLSALFNQIEIGGNIVWNGWISGAVTEETTMDSGGSTPGLPSDYVPLPIELISFNTQLSGSVVEIEFATATELNNDFFTIERSVDGIEWSIIGEIEGAGDSRARLDYQFVDYNPIPGLSYYRLKQTDYDGQFEYFTPSVVLYEPGNIFKVFPNPAQDVLNITTSSNLDNANILIKNLNGQEEKVITSQNSHQAEVDVSNLQQGVYLLEIVFPDNIVTKRIIKE